MAFDPNIWSDAVIPPSERTVFFGGISPQVQKVHLRTLCESEFGPVESIQIIWDYATGQSRGYGFVHFKDVKDANTAKARKTVEYMGRQMDIRDVKERAKSKPLKSPPNAASPFPKSFLTSPIPSPPPAPPSPPPPPPPPISVQPTLWRLPDPMHNVPLVTNIQTPPQPKPVGLSTEQFGRLHNLISQSNPVILNVPKAQEKTNTNMSPTPSIIISPRRESPETSPSSRTNPAQPKSSIIPANKMITLQHSHSYSPREIAQGGQTLSLSPLPSPSNKSLDLHSNRTNRHLSPSKLAAIRRGSNQELQRPPSSSSDKASDIFDPQVLLQVMSGVGNALDILEIKDAVNARTASPSLCDELWNSQSHTSDGISRSSSDFQCWNAFDDFPARAHTWY